MLRCTLALALLPFLSGSDATLIGQWPMTKNAGGLIVDTSGNGNLGTFTGEWVGALPLLGEKNVDFGRPPSLQIGNDSASITCWIAPHPTMQGDSSRKMTRVYGATGSDSFLVMDLVNDGHCVLGFGLRTNENNWTAGSCTSSLTVAFGAWTHVAAIYDRAAGSAKICIDGLEAGSSSLSPALVTATFGTNTLSLGATENGMEGFIRAFTIKRTAMTLSDIKADLAAGSTYAAPTFPAK